jgi:hypothetical protein
MTTELNADALLCRGAYAGSHDKGDKLEGSLLGTREHKGCRRGGTFKMLGSLHDLLQRTARILAFSMGPRRHVTPVKRRHMVQDLLSCDLYKQC